ncbi:uncharacterized protein LOC112528369 [Cynara cardunculus var. scolymus]|uniref:Protein phosphatase 4 core regulatory subunit R2 n=1 Tax=Cynara cardunculus var. scolymus TaxID=59895 RepID=A0A103XS33_CYNCS|nr:uncharacterized protein LOC112528369 [Cynara cardunculus var. scolymus]XP_024995155.1 uncharacterized protein LOC112528369 [Cynara cardunculus var. scolymus]KVH95839.1 Protein phosphatase 4 core regulatory subunit R2 [Cynara cardunculus var. scolymus]
MEIQTTEASEVISTETTETSEVVSTETTETLDQSTLPLVAQQQTTEISKQSPPPITHMPPAETSLPQVTNTQTTEISEQPTQPDVTNTHATEPSDQSTLPPVTNAQTAEAETLEQSALPLLTDTKTAETIEQTVMPSEVADSSHDNLVASPENHQGLEMRQETAEEEEEVRCVLKVIAATGKFWHDWEKLRSMLSLHLKQVISEYPQAKMTKEEQKFSLGETHAELVKRLDDALHSFVDGPPFTLQRLSEIILDAQILYPNLSKLALALEKNLSVTSTLAISTDPYPPSHITTPNGLNKVTEDPNPNQNPQLQSDTVMENGAQPVVADRDEIMTEVEADVGDVMTMDMETYEKSSVDSSPMTTGDS